MEYHVAPEIFERHPDYVRGVVIGRGLTHTAEVPAEALVLLRTAESLVRIRPDLAQLALHDRIASWRNAYAAFGARPSKYLSSVEALVRRVRNGDALRPVSTLVALINAISLHYLLPTGGHDLGAVSAPLALRLAHGGETFRPIGSAEREAPEPGEVIYAEGDTVLCRRWNWRQAEHTRLTPASATVAINLDALPPVTATEVADIAGELAALVTRFCGGVVEVKFLDQAHPVIEV